MNDERLDALVRKTLVGDEDAWRELWTAVEPMISCIAANWRLTSRLSRRSDDRLNIVLQVMERLRADDFRRLRAFAGEENGTFRLWLATVASHTAISYLRAHPEYFRRSSAEARKQGCWVRLELVPEPPDDLQVDPFGEIERHGLFETAFRHLRHDQRKALLLWLEDRDDAEIARLLELADAASARRLVRSALKRLRDRLVPQQGKIDHRA
jgi:DNA-directed RNA polymerase specialized sigma24 family protein